MAGVLARIRSLILLSVRPPKTNPGTPLGDAASHRERRMRRAVLSAFASKLAFAATQLLALPVAVNSLGIDRFALYAVLTSGVSWLGLVNYGFGPGLTLEVAGYAAVGDERGVRRAFGSAVVWSAATLGLLARPSSGPLASLARGDFWPSCRAVPGRRNNRPSGSDRILLRPDTGRVSRSCTSRLSGATCHQPMGGAGERAGRGRLDRMWPVGQSLDRRVSLRDSRRTLGSAVRQRGLGVVGTQGARSAAQKRSPWAEIAGTAGDGRQLLADRVFELPEPPSHAANRQSCDRLRRHRRCGSGAQHTNALHWRGGDASGAAAWRGGRCGDQWRRVVGSSRRSAGTSSGDGIHGCRGSPSGSLRQHGDSHLASRCRGIDAADLRSPRGVHRASTRGS